MTSEQELQRLWNAASRKGNREALAHLRDAFEALALDEVLEASTAANKARHAMGSRYFTKRGKRRTCEGRPVFCHTGSFGIDAETCAEDDSGLLRSAEGLQRAILGIDRSMPSWGTTKRNLLRRLKSARGEILRRGI